MKEYHLGFASPELQQAFEKCRPTLDAFTASLDAMSNDIKALEEALSTRGIRIPFRAELKNHPFGHGCKAELAWEEDPQAKRWRLVLSKTWNAMDAPADVVRPLIETPAADRMFVYPTLGTWLQMLTEQVHVPSLQQHKLPEETL